MRFLNNILKQRFFIFLVFLFFIFSVPVKAQEKISSPNFNIVSPTLSSTGGPLTSTSYLFYSSLGEIADPKLSSTSYSQGVGTPNTFIANVPLVTCFETNTNSSTSECNSSYPNADGTRGEAGYGGFYDRAKFVIDAQSNPSDALYSVQISTDNFNTIYYVDGTTRQLKTTKDLNDFLTKSTWESSPWNDSNILGLIPNTNYQIRITALHGDLTESSPSPERSALTGVPTINFDLDISDSTWPNSTETSAPYNISLGTLSVSSVTTAQNRIYIDSGSNAQSGITIFVQDLYNGLYNAIGNDTVDSPTVGNPSNANLFTQTEGFGIRIANVNTSVPNSFLRDSDYYNAGLSEQVGRLSSTLTDTIMTTAGGIYAGRAQVEVKAKSEGTNLSGNYVDTITFTVSASY